MSTRKQCSRYHACVSRTLENKALEAIQEFGEVMVACPAGDFDVSILLPLLSVNVCLRGITSVLLGECNGAHCMGTL